MELIISLVMLVLLLAVGIFAGGAAERRHLRSLDQREQQMMDILVTNLKSVPSTENIAQSGMVMGQVVIATDYFKSFATSLRNLVGGEAKAAMSLMLRARREALLRMLEQARQMGATEVWNVRFGTSNINQMAGRQGAMQVEMFAWGTAIRRK